jgi:hypothetical protein
MAQIDIRDAVIKIKDGGVGSAQNEIEIKVGEGNFTWTERKNMEYLLDRGNLDEVREGDQAPVEVSFEFKWEYITGGVTTTTIPSIEDALKKVEAASTWVTSDSDPCRPYAVDLEVTYTPDCSSGDVETMTFPDFRYEELSHDLRAGQISCSGQCNVTEATVARSAQA